MRQRYGTSSHFRELNREEGVVVSMPFCFICIFSLIIHAIIDIISFKKDSRYNFGTKFADFRHNDLRLISSFRNLFGESLVLYNGKQS